MQCTAVIPCQAGPASKDMHAQWVHKHAYIVLHVQCRSACFWQYVSQQCCVLAVYRYVPMFGEVNFRPANSYASVPLEEQMGALTAAVTAGKVRHIGLSNETAWGLTKFCQLGMG